MHADMFVVRHAQSGAPLPDRQAPVDSTAHVHVINAGDGRHAHPTQGLLDMYTIRHYKKDFTNLTVAIVGDILHSRVARSRDPRADHAGRAGSARHRPAHAAARRARAAGRAGVSPTWTRACKDVDVVIMLRLQNERMSGALLPSAQEYLQELRPDAGEAGAGQAGRHRHAPGPDEPRRGNRFGGRRRRAGGDPAAGDLRHRGADGGDEHLAGNCKPDETPYQERPRDRPGQRHRRRRTTCSSPTARSSPCGTAPAGFAADRIIDASRPGRRARAWSTCRRACASRATNTRPRSNPKCRPPCRAA